MVLLDTGLVLIPGVPSLSNPAIPQGKYFWNTSGGSHSFSFSTSHSSLHLRDCKNMLCEKQGRKKNILKMKILLKLVVLNRISVSFNLV